VRHHVAIQAGGELPPQMSRRSVGALSAVAHAMLEAPATLDEVVERIAPQADLDVTLVLRGARQLQVEMAEAFEHGR